MIDPNLGNMPTLANFLLVIGLLAFLSLGGHLVLISVLVDSYRYIPIGEGLFASNAISGFISWSSQMFIGAVSLVLPVLLGLLMVNVCLGVVLSLAWQIFSRLAFQRLFLLALCWSP